VLMWALIAALVALLLARALQATWPWWGRYLTAARLALLFLVALPAFMIHSVYTRPHGQTTGYTQHLPLTT
jgi:hypothetical protein